MTSERTYCNRWIPDGAVAILRAEKGTILDVGGGSSPYAGAAHVLDIGEYSESRLSRNFWDLPDPARDGALRRSDVRWSANRYTQFDLCGGQPWPFGDKQFDLGLCSHTLEDIRDPLPAVRELCRVCERVLIVCPSRLAEQTMGVDHPLLCGFPNHLWMVYEENGILVFRRKADIVYLRGCHIRCPPGKTLARNAGAMFLAGVNVRAEERMFSGFTAECDEYRTFLAPYRKQKDIFVSDGHNHSLKYWAWRLRQVLLNAP